jgi:hypothetical protein
VLRAAPSYLRTTLTKPRAKMTIQDSMSWIEILSQISGLAICHADHAHQDKTLQFGVRDWFAHEGPQYFLSEWDKYNGRRQN